jgi:hypothetical protein
VRFVAQECQPHRRESNSAAWILPGDLGDPSGSAGLLACRQRAVESQSAKNCCAVANCFVFILAPVGWIRFSSLDMHNRDCAVHWPIGATKVDRDPGLWVISSWGKSRLHWPRAEVKCVGSCWSLGLLSSAAVWADTAGSPLRLRRRAWW